MRFVALSFTLVLLLAPWVTHAQVLVRTLQLDLQAHVDAESSAQLRFALSDLQPSGIHVRAGQTLTVEAGAFSADHHLSARIGFHPVWDNRNPSQETRLVPGKNTLQATTSGLLYFVFHNRQPWVARPEKLTVTVSGGQDSPLFVLGKTDHRQWRAQVLARKDDPYVEWVSDRVLITLPTKDFLKNPIKDPQKTFEAIHRVLDTQDRLAGFDGSAPIHTPSRNRTHFLVDEWARQSDGFYMYATDFHVGLMPESVGDLVRPELLAKRWGIWHEIGHTHQQWPWTWEDVVEVTVNIFALKQQADGGWPSRLHDREYGEDGRRHKLSSYALAARYLQQKNKRFSDLRDPFVKLVMFDQLRQAFGWGFYTQLFKAYRERYQSPDLKDQTDDMGDAEKVNAFVWMSSQVARTNLLPFFRHWGLNPDHHTVARIESQPWPATTVTGGAGQALKQRAGPPGFAPHAPGRR